jgi:D-glycero-D-manno-heptose 1,7-bisphosphate phosphatase
MRRRAVFLDRDGVLNRAIVVDGVPHPPLALADLEILPGVRDACELLRAARFMLVMVTNQPDIARGKQTWENVAQINEFVRGVAGIEVVEMCPHDDVDNCACRKPRPGMLLSAAHAHDIELQASFMVGDRSRDIVAGRAAGCRTVFIDRGYETEPRQSADLVASSLPEAARWIVGLSSTSKGVLDATI